MLQKKTTSLPVLLVCCSLLLWPSGKKNLDSLNERIKKTEIRLGKLQKEKSSILNDIYKIELKQERTTAELRKLKIQVAMTGEKIEQKQRQKEKLKKEISRLRESLGEALRILYKLGKTAYVKFFVSVENIDQLFRNYRLFASLVQYKSTEINALRANIKKLEELDKGLQKERGKLLDFQGALELNLKKTSDLKKRKYTMIESINKDRRSYLRLLDELQKEADRLDKFINDEDLKNRIGPMNLKKLKGRLPWPLKGKVISSFGKKRSTQFDTYIFNNGIEIKPIASDEVKAVYDGEVVFCDYFKGYGKLVIIQHANNFYSLYGHCSKILKNKGDRVTEGDIVSLAGNSGSTYGKSLYLEIRKDLKPQDPLLWLRKSD